MRSFDTLPFHLWQICWYEPASDVRRLTLKKKSQPLHKKKNCASFSCHYHLPVYCHPVLEVAEDVKVQLAFPDAPHL